MEHQYAANSEETRNLTPDQLLFEGPVQDTVEILPRTNRLSERDRETSVVAGVGRARVTRQVGEGRPAAAVAVIARDPRTDELLAVTYQVAAFFTIVVVGVLIATAVAIVVTSSVAR